MAEIEAAFEAARAEGRAALMPYMMAGYPDQATSLAVAAAYADAGADLIELGVPFSDPLADGPVIHAAATAALANGATLASALEVCESISARLPVVLMAYANMVLAHGGAAEFARRASGAGASGAIVPDLPLGEAEEIREAFAADLALVPLVAPTTPAERRARICAAAVLEQPGDRVSGLQRRDDSLQPRQLAEGGKGLLVGDGDVAGAAGVAQVGVLGADAGIVEASRDRVRLENLPLLIGQHRGERAV